MIVAMRQPVHTSTTHRGRLLTVEVRSFADEQGRQVQREVVHHPGAVVIVPVRADGKTIATVLMWERFGGGSGGSGGAAA